VSRTREKQRFVCKTGIIKTRSHNPFSKMKNNKNISVRKVTIANAKETEGN
jgi:hypothetical protein